MCTFTARALLEPIQQSAFTLDFFQTLFNPEAKIAGSLNCTFSGLTQCDVFYPLYQVH